MVLGSAGETTAGRYAPAADMMLMLFLCTLEVRVRGLKMRQGVPDGEIAVLDDVAEGIDALRGAKAGDHSEDTAWTAAYRLESLVALVEPRETLLDEIRRRLDEAASEKVATEPRHRLALQKAEAEYMTPNVTPPTLVAGAELPLRTLLGEILEDLHWAVQRKFFARPLIRRVSANVMRLTLIAFGLLIMPFVVLYFLYSGYYTGSPLPMTGLAWLPLYFALASGLFGAAFSRLLFIQRNRDSLSVNELKSEQDLSAIIFRCSVGMCGALTVFLFLQSGIVKGSLFPDFTRLDLTDVPAVRDVSPVTCSSSMRLILPSANLALMMMWCFLAGFSERLVPTILTSTEESLANASKGVKS